MGKPREFWINEDYCTSSMVPDDDPSYVHLIEKSAYDKAIRMLKHIRQHMRIVMNDNNPHMSTAFVMSDKVLQDLGES